MSSTPRVFHLITRLLKGGAEAKTIDTVLGLDGYDFVVGHGASFDPEQVAHLQQNGVGTQRFRTIRHYNPVTAVPAVAAVARYLQTEEFDIVHTHSTEAGIIGRFAAALVDAPAVVHTVHGVPFTSDRPPTLNRFVLSCERRAATVTDRLITNADAITTAYLGRNIGRREQYRTVYSGIDINRFRDAEPATDIDGSGVRVLCVARLVEGKGIEDLLAAVNRTDDQTLSVYLVGDGPHRSEIEREIPRRDLSQRVHVLGYRDDIPELMAACDLFVLPSYREGTPRVITEAMASGLPVIATDIAGIPEQIEEGTNGFLIQPGNIPALVDRLDRLAAAPSIRESFGAAGQQRAERFSRERMCADLADVYADVLSNR